MQELFVKDFVQSKKPPPRPKSALKQGAFFLFKLGNSNAVLPHAEAAGADYIGVGPIYPTQTNKDVCAPVTLDYLDWVVANSPLPFVAIGGIKRHNIADVVAHGARCCALVSELVGAPDIAARVAEVRAAMRGRGQG